ncbi:fimbrial adhesin, MrxH [Xenorhabdus poinarii G6]|uniref:Fimbrial adhesin, MrxH n=1 Tax=Xenorhabdus poinarii G6 TaxID=1354304 RepID=A0A068R5J0_9GAMM|nr:hypothetical protein [Xenorhabdus poinarii]CDG22488.1 fimbrial adhesin, MrxH [Xenorhabdus poinarii G6]
MYHIKKTLLKLAALFILVSTAHAYAGAYVMPVNMEVVYGQARATLEIIAWTEEEGIPNPCYGNEQCYVGPDVNYRNGYPPGMYGSCHDSRVCLENAHLYPTTADVMRAYKRQFGVPIRVSFPIISTEADCVGLFYSEKLNPEYGDAQQFPDSTCNKTPPPNQNCKLNLPSEIAYGELIAREVNNQTRTITGQFSCAVYSDQIMLLARSINNEERVYLDSDRQIYSTLHINGKNAENGVNITAPGNNIPVSFNLKSVLHTITLPKPGQYEGTAVVFLTYL